MYRLWLGAETLIQPHWAIGGGPTFNEVMRAATKSAFRQLGPGCKKFFDVDPSTTSGTNNLQDVDKHINGMTFKDARGLPGDDSVALTLFNIDTVILGGLFFNPANDVKVLPQETKDDDFRRNALVHEYMHSKWDMNDVDLYNEWGLRRKGYTGRSDLPSPDRESDAIRQFIAFDCKSKL